MSGKPKCSDAVMFNSQMFIRVWWDKRQNLWLIMAENLILAMKFRFWDGTSTFSDPAGSGIWSLTDTRVYNYCIWGPKLEHGKEQTTQKYSAIYIYIYIFEYI